MKNLLEILTVWWKISKNNFPEHFLNIKSTHVCTKKFNIDFSAQHIVHHKYLVQVDTIHSCISYITILPRASSGNLATLQQRENSVV